MRFANRFGFCEVNQLPGCPQIAVFNNACIYPGFRSKGHGNRNHALRLKRAAEMGYDFVLCTADANNKAERKILQKNGWLCFAQFPSTSTAHLVEMWGKRLRRRA